MTKTEIAVIHRAITMLRSLIAEPPECPPLERPCPVRRFVQEYLASDPDADLSCAEAWQFFQEVARSGELSPTRKAVFLRQLPIEMENVLHLRKCHHVERGGHRVRGFRGVGIRLDACPVTPKAEPK